MVAILMVSSCSADSFFYLDDLIMCAFTNYQALYMNFCNYISQKEKNDSYFGGYLNVSLCDGPFSLSLY